MSLHPCCRSVIDEPAEPAATEVTTPNNDSRRFSRIRSALKWITPTAVLVLIPKCPMCVAAYIALGTGVSIAMPVATWIRYGLFVACFAMLGYLALNVIRRRMPRWNVAR